VALPSAPHDWPAFVANLRLGGMAGELAAQTEMRRLEGSALTLALPAAHQHLTAKMYSDRLRAALEQATGVKVLLAFEVGDATDGSLASRTVRERDATKARTEAAFRDEPFVRDVVSRFEATVRADSIRPHAANPANEDAKR
jgi:DNA polymerase-3 subunit gamma/tau